MNESTVPSPLFPAPPSAPPVVIPPPSTDPLAKVMLSRGFEVFRRAWGPILVAALCVIFSQIPMQVVSMAVNIATMPAPRAPGAPPAMPVFAAAQVGVLVLSFLYGILVVMPLSVGLVVFVANVSRGRAVEWSLLFSAFRRYGAVVVSNLIQMAVGIAIMSCAVVVVGGLAWVASSAAGDAAAFAIAIPLGLVALGFSIWVSVRLSFASVSAADPTLPPRSGVDAVKYSWRISEGHVLNLIVGFIAVTVIVMLSVLLLCVGYILVGIPFLCAAYGATYDELVRRDHALTPA